MTNTNSTTAEIIRQAQDSLPKTSGKNAGVVLRSNIDHPGKPFEPNSKNTSGQAIAKKALEAFHITSGPKEVKITPINGEADVLDSSKVTALPSHLKSQTQGRGNLRFFSDNLGEMRNQFFKADR
jgi:hypothetical protein